MLAEITPNGDERAAVKGDDKAIDRLIGRLADVASAVGPTPSELTKVWEARISLGTLAAMADQQLWQCQLCGYDAGGDVKPAVIFEHIPAGWSCPIWGVEKDYFLIQDDVEV